jgi:N-acetylmuramoyl-L-alanine amidase
MPFTEKFLISKQYLPSPTRRRSGVSADTIKFIVVHDTGNPGSTARGNVQFYTDTADTVEKKKTASAHLFVDDKQIIECVPALTAKPEKAWHVLYDRPADNELFGADANDAAIGIEYCFGGKINADLAYEKYVWLIAKTCDVFLLDPASCIVSHAFLDPKRKTDPITGLAHSRRSYEQLLADVQLEFKLCRGEIALPALNVNSSSGKVVTLANLNIRRHPNRKGEKLQTIPKGVTLSFNGVVSDGEIINNNATWYRMENGSFFWSGGVRAL